MAARLFLFLFAFCFFFFFIVGSLYRKTGVYVERFCSLVSFGKASFKDRNRIIPFVQAYNGRFV